jgi:hypothetical protein
MGHNVWMHLTAVQEANRRFDAGEYPAMMRRSKGDFVKFEDVVEAIFAAPDKETALEIIEHYSTYWMEIIGTRGQKGQKAFNSTTSFDSLFTFAAVTETEDDDVEFDGTKLDALENQ